MSKVIAFGSTASLLAVSLSVGTLQGQVMRGPVTPVCLIGKPCDAPAARVRLFFTRSGTTTGGTTASVVTDANGAYRVRLAAGTYAVRTNQRPFGATPQPRTARVVAGVVRRVDFHIDTGIR